MKLKVFCLVVSMFATGYANADIVSDQSYLDEAGDFGIGEAAAQTFTVGVTGVLSHVELRLGGQGSATGNFFAYVRSAPDGTITGPNLGALTVPRSSLPFPIQPSTYISLDFSSQNIHVTAGDGLAIIVDIGGTPGVDWGLGETVQVLPDPPIGGYPGGHAMVGGSSGFVLLPSNPSHPNVVGLDFNFRTFVQPIPEPSRLIACVLITALGISVALWRRH